MTRIQEIIHRFFENNYSKLTEKEFYKWLTNSQDEEEKDLALREIWNGLDIKADEFTEESFEQLQRRIAPAAKRKSFYPKLLRIAGILLIPIVSLGLSYAYIKTQSLKLEQNSTKFVEHFVPNGEVHTVILSDSSKVQLNAGSIFIYPEKFTGDSRDVYLNGEACFTVERNEDSPFIVKTADLEITVLGTIFNVSSFASNNISSTTLERGKVSVGVKGKELESVVLLPDEQLLYNRKTGELEKRSIDADNILAWVDGHLLLKNVTVSEIADILVRKYNVNIYLRSNRYNNERITAKFIQDEKVSDVLATLAELINNFRYEIDGQNIYIY